MTSLSGIRTIPNGKEIGHRDVPNLEKWVSGKINSSVAILDGTMYSAKPARLLGQE
jgi:hypothetical protein